jgi:hypothetical protein
LVNLHAITLAWRAASTAQRVAIVIGLLIGVIALSAILSRPAGSHPALQPTGTGVGSSVTISIDSTLHPRLTPGQVADLAVAEIGRNEAILGRTLAPVRLLSITAVPGERIDDVEPGAARLAPPVTGIVWVVRAEGTLATDRGLASPRPSATSGYYLVLDADGSVLGMGFPLVSPGAT